MRRALLIVTFALASSCSPEIDGEYLLPPTLLLQGSCGNSASGWTALPQQSERWTVEHSGATATVKRRLRTGSGQVAPPCATLTAELDATAAVVRPVSCEPIVTATGTTVDVELSGGSLRFEQHNVSSGLSRNGFPAQCEVMQLDFTLLFRAVLSDSGSSNTCAGSVVGTFRRFLGGNGCPTL